MQQFNYIRSMIKVVLLGAGNVGFHLTSEMIKTNGIQVVQVYNRTLDKIRYLKKSTLITNNLNKLELADIYIICVSDNAISMVSSKIPNINKLVVHTSGGTSINELKTSNPKGVFYLLQTFSKNRISDFSSIPICIEAEKTTNLNLLKKLASLLSKKVYNINSEERIQIHLAAIFVNNFVNYLYVVGNEICDKNNVSFEILKPLILETAQKIIEISPLDAQTGPAKRNDTKIIDKHLKILSKNQLEIYKLLTKYIAETYGKKL